MSDPTRPPGSNGVAPPFSAFAPAPAPVASDAKLPGLAIAADPAAMTARLERMLADRLPRREPLARVEVRVLKHSPGKRCVLEYVLETGSGAVTRLIGKLHRGERGLLAFERHVALWNAMRGSALAMAEPIGWVGDLGLVLQSVVPGVRIDALTGEDERIAAARATADALLALHAARVSSLAPRSLADHLARTCRPAPEALCAALPERTAAIERVLAAASAWRGPVAVAHGDLGLAQVFAGAEQAAFVDWDGLCLASPALDVANFIVSIENGLGPRGAALERAFLERYAAGCAPGALAGLAVHTAAAWTRRAAAALRGGVDAETRWQAADRVERAARALDAPVPAMEVS